MDDVKIKVIDSDKLINAINEGSYEVNLSAVMALGGVLFDTKKQELTRTFVELVVKYPDPELCAYKEYKGKPYYSIKYIENGEAHVGYGTYNPEVLSQYLKEYFISSELLKPHYCRECKWSQYRLTGKYVNTETYWYCFNWGYDTDEEGYCHKFERRTDEYTN